MQHLVQNHLGLVIVSAIMALATLILTFIAYPMRAAGLSLRPIAYVGVFFALILLPQFVGHLAMTIWPKPKPELNPAAFAGRDTFEHPEYIFGANTHADTLRDARPVFPEMLATAEVAQFHMDGTGNMTLAARFGAETDARNSAATFWTAFALSGTSGSEEKGWWGTRQPAGDTVHLKRVGPGLAMWIGPNKDAVRTRLAEVRLSTTPPDTRPEWLRSFDRIPVRIASVVLLVVLASTWFLKGAGWASRIEATSGAPVSASELSRRLSDLKNAESLQQTSETEWELIVHYDTIGEVGYHRYQLRLDPQKHRVLVTEYIGRRASPSGSYNWRKEAGITFFRKAAGVDLQREKGPIARTVTEAGWVWQPVMWDVPSLR